MTLSRWRGCRGGMSLSIGILPVLGCLRAGGIRASGVPKRDRPTAARYFPASGCPAPMARKGKGVPEVSRRAICSDCQSLAPFLPPCRGSGQGWRNVFASVPAVLPMVPRHFAFLQSPLRFCESALRQLPTLSGRSRNGCLLAGNGFLLQGNGFLLLGSDFLLPGTGFLLRGNGFLPLGNDFLLLGNGFLLQGSDFLPLGNVFLLLGSDFLLQGNGFLLLGNDFLLQGNGFLLPGICRAECCGRFFVQAQTSFAPGRCIPCSQGFQTVWPTWHGTCISMSRSLTKKQQSLYLQTKSYKRKAIDRIHHE